MNTKEFIWKYYDTGRYWVEYAEKKNAVLFTIVGIEMAVLKFLEKPANIQYINITIIFLLAAFFISLLSFYPKTDRFYILKNYDKSPKKYDINLLYFDDIKNLECSKFIEKMELRYEVKLGNDKLIFDLCDQIIILSRIASAKFRLFKLAFYAAVCGQASLIVILILNLVFSA